MTIAGLVGALRTLPEDCAEPPTANGQSSWSGNAPVPIECLLDKRGTSHGDYKLNADISQRLKMAMRDSPNWEALTPTEKESLELIATKIGRILAGNPHLQEHWTDLSGYAQLIARGS